MIPGGWLPWEHGYEPAITVPPVPRAAALPVFATARERAWPVAERVSCGESYGPERATVRLVRS